MDVKNILQHMIIEFSGYKDSSYHPSTLVKFLGLLYQGCGFALLNSRRFRSCQGKNGNRANPFEWGEMGSWVITCNPYLWSCGPLLIWLLGACFVVSTMAVSKHLTGHGIIASAGHWPCPPLPTRHGMNESSHCWVAIQLDHCFYNIWCLKSLIKCIICGWSIV